MKTKLEMGLESALNLPVLSPIIEIISPPSAAAAAVTADVSEAEGDFQVARKNIKNIINQGEEALAGILDLASASEHPRTFEVAGQLIKTLVDANKDLLGLHKKIRDLMPPEQIESAKQVTNNAYFVGSTAELQQLVNKRKVE